MHNEKIFKIAAKEQKIQLVNGEFTPSQASDVIMSLINQKINYHKIEGLQLWERNHKYDQEPLSNRIKELEVERKIASDFISKMREEGKNLKITGILKMTALE
ncbi:hypothetical protein [Gelidibacter japonicus]|jgi:hypothetical protein|uniref:hypothetical protein n=1 Tax=Gelidibacter japonicus TaxID=1962232 RepID=UPI003A90BF83